MQIQFGSNFRVASHVKQVVELVHVEQLELHCKH